MKTGDPIEDYPEYMHDAVNDIWNGDFVTKIKGFYRLIIGIVIFPIIIIIKHLT